MTLLDTNYLLRSLISGTSEAECVDGRLDDAEPLCTAGVCWYEFHSGPVDEEAVSLIRGVLQERILPFTDETAVEAARLFNAAGRPRRLPDSSMWNAGYAPGNLDSAGAAATSALSARTGGNGNVSPRRFSYHAPVFSRSRLSLFKRSTYHG